MKIPQRLEPLIEDGLIEYVLRPLRSGKEADIFVVEAYGEIYCAKVYKEKNKRNFHSQVLYQEGRNRRNSRSTRALGKHSKYGKQVEEKEWQQSEVETLFKLHAAGVVVPVPSTCASGVLLMELVLGADGEVAPQLGDIEFDAEEAKYCHDYLLREVILMLLAGVVHADLSEYNVVMAYNGPVIIDFPQAVDATTNNNAQFFLERDVRNLTHFFGRFAPELLEGDFGLEIWQHYHDGTLTKDIELTGKPIVSNKEVDVQSIFREIEEARYEAEQKKAREDGIEPTADEEMANWFEPKWKKRAPAHSEKKSTPKPVPAPVAKKEAKRAPQKRATTPKRTPPRRAPRKPIAEKTVAPTPSPQAQEDPQPARRSGNRWSRKVGSRRMQSETVKESVSEVKTQVQASPAPIKETPAQKPEKVERVWGRR
jgi:RIO kinase 1